MSLRRWTPTADRSEAAREAGCFNLWLALNRRWDAKRPDGSCAGAELLRAPSEIEPAEWRETIRSRVRHRSRSRSDLEQDLRVRRRNAGGRARWSTAGDLNSALKNLDDYCSGADFIVGHNILDFDLPQLAGADPALALLQKA